MQTQKYIVLKINPTDRDRWNRLQVSDAVTSNTVNLDEMLQDLVQTPGQYLLAVEITVQILDQTPLKVLAEDTLVSEVRAA